MSLFQSEISQELSRVVGLTDEQLMTIAGTVAGLVQRVGFRWFVRRAATQRGIVGIVRNLADGRVEFSAQGDPQQIKLFLEEVRKGPSGSRVDSVVTRELPRDDSLVGFIIGG